jgi:hypothetical protein
MLGPFNHVNQGVQPREGETAPVAVDKWCKNHGYVAGIESYSAAAVVAGYSCVLLDQHPSGFSHPATLHSSPQSQGRSLE